jgi:Domain of unknown function (DUF6867)
MAAALLGGPVASFCALTALFTAAAATTGHALARNWRPAWQILPYALLLAAGDRFLLFALFGARLLAASGWAVAALILVAAGAGAYRATRARGMVRQYPWLYESAGWFGWRERNGDDRA